MAKNGKGSINSLDDAIQAGYRICVPQFLESKFQFRFPSANFVGAPVHEEQVYFNSGNCDALLFSVRELLRLHAGVGNEHDCQQLETCTATPGKKGCELKVTRPNGVEISWPSQEAKWSCKRNDHGTPDATRDCGLKKVGFVVDTVSLAMPVGRKFVEQFNAALLKTIDSGLLKTLMRSHQEAMFPNMCGDSETTDSADSLDVDALYGTLLLCGASSLVALIWGGVDRHAKIVSLFCGDHVDDEPAHLAGKEETDTHDYRSQVVEHIGASENGIMEVLSKPDAQQNRMEAKLDAQQNKQLARSGMCGHDTKPPNEMLKVTKRVRKADGETDVDVAIRLFERYDLDHSSTVNTSEEAQQITTNLLYTLGITVPSGVLEQELLALSCKDGFIVTMDFDNYWQWFQNTFYA